MKKTFFFKKLSSELEDILLEELHTLKGGAGGNSENWLDEVIIIGEPPREQEEEEEEEEEPEDPEIPDPWDDPSGWWWGSGPDPAEENEPAETPCNDVAKAANAKTTALAKQTPVQSQLANFATNTTNEQAFSIRKTGSTYSASAIQTLGPTGGGIINYGNSVADVHTHPSSNAPSAQDIIGLGQMRSVNSNFETRYIKAADGDMYAITISDSSKATSFYNTFKHSVGSNNEWRSDTSIGQQFAAVKADYLQKGATAEQAYDHATAFVLSNSGITLVKAPNGSNDFTKIGTTENVDENGVKSYSSSDCPR